jgi:diphthamide biosynthesis methyltransferase
VFTLAEVTALQGWPATDARHGPGTDRLGSAFGYLAVVRIRKPCSTTYQQNIVRLQSPANWVHTFVCLVVHTLIFTDLQVEKGAACLEVLAFLLIISIKAWHRFSPF